MYSTDTFSFFSTISRGMMSSIVFFGDGSPRYESGPARGVGSQNWKKPPYGVGSGSRSNENGVWWMPTKTPSLTTYLVELDLAVMRLVWDKKGEYAAPLTY